MGRQPKSTKGHTGQTDGGNTRDIKVDRIDKVTIYKRGESYYLSYRENGKSQRQRIDGNLSVAGTMAAKVAASLRESRPSPLGFEKTAPAEMVEAYLAYVADVQQLAWRTHNRYQAPLDKFVEYATESGIASVDAVHEGRVEDYVRWLCGQTRVRNGANKGDRRPYQAGGIKFILCTCRTAFNWAMRRRMLPPYTENPFSRFPIDRLQDADQEDEGKQIFTPEQEKNFFAACNDLQGPILRTLAAYGLRVSELTHLLVNDVDFENGAIHIRSKPFLGWRVKTSRRRQLPLTIEMRTLFENLIEGRKAGFVFLNEAYAMK